MNLKDIILKIEHFDSLVFSLLTRQKTIVVGVGKMSDEFYKFIHQIIPEDLKVPLTYQSNVKTLENTCVISGIEMNEQSMKLLDKAQGNYTVVFLPNNEVYGQFTSPFCRKIAILLKDDKTAELKEELSIFYQKAIESDEMTTPADYMVANDMNKADASLLLWVRALHFNKEIDRTVISNMEW